MTVKAFIVYILHNSGITKVSYASMLENFAKKNSLSLRAAGEDIKKYQVVEIGTVTVAYQAGELLNKDEVYCILDETRSTKEKSFMITPQFMKEILKDFNNTYGS